MAGVDSIMEVCPLKHEIRVKFWTPFIKKLRKKEVKYLTLYSPPLMDVKYLHQCNLIPVVDGVYSSVVGVTIDKEAFSDSNTTLNYRLGLLLHDDINNLLRGTNKSASAKQLIDKFPFDVINLDYTDALHKYKANVALSPHFDAIETILKKQKGYGSFILFITAYFDLSAYNKGFLDSLSNIIDQNVESTPNFLQKLQDVFNSTDSKTFFQNSASDFFSIGVLKFILLQLKDHSYDLKTAGIKWLIRDRKQPATHMLHLAFHIKDFVPPIVKARDAVGTRKNNVEHQSVDYLRSDFPRLIESVNFADLFKIHGEEISNLHNKSFELDVPDPTIG
jgi:hypothetical protein